MGNDCSFDIIIMVNTLQLSMTQLIVKGIGKSEVFSLFKVWFPGQIFTGTCIHCDIGCVTVSEYTDVTVRYSLNAQKGIDHVSKDMYHALTIHMNCKCTHITEEEMRLQYRT